MTKSAIYCLSGAQNSKLVISHDDLRSLFNQVEAEFCQSEVYQKAFEGLQKRLGHAPKWVNLLIKAIGREAIRLTLRQVVNQFHAEETPHQSDALSPQQPQHRAEQHHNQGHAFDSSQDNRLDNCLRNKPSHGEHVSPLSPIDYREHQHRSSCDSASTGSTQGSSTGYPSADMLMETPAMADRRTDRASQSIAEHSSDPVPSATHSPALQRKPQKQPRAQSNTVFKQNAEAIAPSASSAPSGQVTPPAHVTPSAHVTPLDQTTSPNASLPLKSSNASAQPRSPFTQRKSQRQTTHDASGQAYQEIGIKLKQARLEKSLTLRQVHEQTKVGIHQIEAIESGNLERLPEEIYVKGFIRQVARVVGVEYDSLMELLPQQPAKSTDIPLRYTRIPAASSRSAASRRNVFRPAHLYIGYAALMASATGGLIWASHSQSAAQLESFDIPFDLPLDLPQMFDDLRSMFNVGQSLPNESQHQKQYVVPEAIATPEVIMVESSMPPH